MRDPRDMMIERQAQIISDQRKANDELTQKIGTLRSQVNRLKDHAKFYTDMTDQIQKSPTLQAEWDRFLTFLKMAAEDTYLQSNGAYRGE